MMYNILVKAITDLEIEQSWYNYVSSNFSEDQFKVFNFILDSFPESILLIDKVIPNDDVISVLALIAYDLGNSREVINNLRFSKDLGELISSIDLEQDLSENNKKLLFLLLSDIGSPVTESDLSLSEKFFQIVTYRDLFEDSYLYIKNRGTLPTIRSIISNYFSNFDTAVAFEAIIGSGYTENSINLINSQDISTSGINVYNTTGIAISGGQEYTFSISRDYTDGAPFSLTIERYAADEITLLNNIIVEDDADGIVVTVLDGPIPEFKFDYILNTWYITFLTGSSEALLFFNFSNNGNPYIIGNELEDVQLALGSILRPYTSYMQYSKLQCSISTSGASINIMLGSLELLVDSMIDYSNELTEATEAPYTYNIKQDNLLYKYLMSVKPAGFVYNIQTTSTKPEASAPTIDAPTITLLGVNYIDKTYEVSIKNNSTLPVTVHVWDYAHDAANPSETVDSYTSLIQGGYTKVVSRAADNINFNEDDEVTYIEAYAEYSGTESSPAIILHTTDNPISLVLLSTNVSLTKNSDYKSGYADLSIYNRNAVPVIAKVACSWDGGTTYFNRQYTISPNSYSGSKKFYNSSLVPKSFMVSVVLEDNNGLGYGDSDPISKSVSMVRGVYVPDGDGDGDGPIVEPY